MPSRVETVENELAGSKLPPLPHVLVELLGACQDETLNFQDLARIVASDGPLAAQLIMVANTSWYSRHSKVQSIERALMLLGTDALKTLAITVSVQQMCNGIQPASSACYSAHYKDYWKRSLRCALIAKALAHLTSFSSPEEAYLVGLLHNVGELVLAINHPDEYPLLLSGDNSSQMELEESRFQINHCELGGRLAQQWGLDLLAVDAIAWHHEPVNEVADAHHLTKLIFLAARLAQQPDQQLGENNIDLSGFEAAERLFDMSGALAREIAAKVSGEVTKIASALGIDLQSDDHSDMTAMQTRLGQQLQRRMVNHEMTGLLRRDDPRESNLAATDTLQPETIAQAVNIMFGYRNARLLDFDVDQNALVYVVAGASSGNIFIPLASSNSLIAGCAKSRSICWSHRAGEQRADVTIVDRQFMRLCGAPNMVCAPVSVGADLHAVLVMGDTSTSPPDSVSLALIEDFCRHVAARMLLREDSSADVDVHVQRIKDKVSEVVHEVNNPLTIIRNYLQALSSSAEKGATDREAREYRILREEVDRAGQILMRLQDLEVDAAAVQDGVSLNQEIKSLVSVFQQSIFRSHKVECVLKLSSALDKTSLPRNPLRQIVTNLVKNAVEAMPAGGCITLSTAIIISSEKGKAAQLLVADDGPGLPEKIINNVFQPGYSTKEGNHSGLGLSISRGLVEEIGGLISCQSSEQGTEFRIVIPIA